MRGHGRLRGASALAAAMWLASWLAVGEVEAQEKAGKFALLVAIDDYGAAHTPSVPEGQQWAALHGTVNDVALLAVELKQRGFEVAMVSNKDATRKGIIDAFRVHLADKVKAGRGDVVFFHYSGHGQQIPDDNGAPDEVDGYDEALVPYDNRGTHDYSNHLRDEQLGGLVKELASRTPNVIISLDSCHSGTGTRGAMARRGGPAVHPPAKARGPAAEEGSGLLEPVGTRGAGEKRYGYVLLSATLPTQYAREVQDPDTKQNMGVFTWGLIRALRRSGPTTTWRDLMDQVAVEVTGRVTDQNPQLEGDLDNLIFSGSWAPSPPYFKVQPKGNDGLFRVDAGRLHGLTLGSVLGLYPPGSGAMDPARPALKATVTRLEVGAAWATPEGEAKGFEFGGRAIEILSQHTPSLLRVLIPKAGAGLTKGIEGLKFAATVAPDKAADPRGNPAWDVKLVVDGGLVSIQRADGTPVPIPQGPEREMAASLPLEGAAEGVAQALNVEFRRRRLLALVNDDAGSRADVTMAVKHVDAIPVPGGAPKITKVHGDVSRDGTGALKIGAIVQFEVHNRSERDLHFSIVELSADGGIDVIYPVDGMRTGENKLGAKQRRGLSEVLFMMAPPKGSVTWKVIATEDDVDFKALALKVKSGSTRGATRGAESPLAQLMEMAMDGTRAKPFGYAPAKLWGSDAVQIQILPE